MIQSWNTRSLFGYNTFCFIPRLSCYCTVCVNKMILNNEKIPETHKVAFFNFVAGRKTCKGTIATITGSLSTHVKDVD